MQRIHNVKHPANAVKLMAYSFFLKVGYYGLSPLLFMILVNKNKFEHTQFSEIMDQKFFVFILAYAISGLLATFWLTNKKWMMLGSALLVAGAICLLSHRHAILYAGLLLMGVGYPMATINQMSAFIFAYNDNRNGLYSGYMILYLIISIAGYLSPILLGFVGLKHPDIATSIVAFSFLISFVLSFSFHKLPKTYEFTLQLSNNQKIRNLSISFGVLLISLIILSVMFTNLYGLDIKFRDVLTAYSFQSGLYLLVTNVYSWVLILLGLFLSIVLLFYKPNYFKTILIGLVFLLLAVVTLQMVPESVKKTDLAWVVIAFIFMAVAELLIIPMSYVVMSIHFKPKYLSLGLGVFMALTVLSMYLVKSGSKYLSLLGLSTLISLITLGIGYIAFRNKKDDIDL